MKAGKYYDHKNGRQINSELEGCRLSEWASLYGEVPFARDESGFLVFSPPDKVLKNDEYVNSDPYSVEKEINSSFHQRRIELTIELLRKVILPNSPPMQVLDLGCGQGHITGKMHSFFGRSAEFSGLDYSISAIKYAREHFPEIDFVVGDAYEPPYRTAFFDVIVCNNIWEHVPDPLVLLSQIKMVLKPGGYVVISTPSRYRLSNLVRVFLGKKITFMSNQHVTEYTVGQVVEQLEYGGFRVESVLSKKIRQGWLSTVVSWVFGIWIKAVSSHHRLESTVFYLARKK